MKIFIFIFTTIFIASCSFAPKYTRPKMELPETFGYSNGSDNVTGAKWWEYFGSESLNLYVDEVISNNKDTAIAAARAEQAAAAFAGARSSLLPTFDVEASGSDTWVKGDKIFGSTMPYSAGFYASWEIDIFGKYRNAADAAKAQLLATEAAWYGVHLSIIGEAVKGYYLSISLGLQLSIAEDTVTSREKTVSIYEERYNMGLISKLDFARMKSSLETAKTALYKTRISKEQADNAMLLLLGRQPKAIMEGRTDMAGELKDFEVKPIIPSGLPSKLLERRPDIKEAEYGIIASNAEIGSAKAAWFPNISLTGMFGIVSNELEGLFRNPMLTWSYGAGASMPLFYFGRIMAGINLAEAKKKEALLNYEKTVQNAFGDLRNALTSQKELENIVKSLSLMRDELENAYDLIKLQYDDGYAAYLDVLDTERSLFQAELDLATARNDYIASIVQVCLALGGGWYKEVSSAYEEDSK